MKLAPGWEHIRVTLTLNKKFRGEWGSFEEGRSFVDGRSFEDGHSFEDGRSFTRLWYIYTCVKSISLVPRHKEGGGKRASGTHCLCMHIIIAKAMWQNSGHVLI